MVDGDLSFAHMKSITLEPSSSSPKVPSPSLVTEPNLNGASWTFKRTPFGFTSLSVAKVHNEYSTKSRT